ncbi:hypothetical protein Pan241w_26410 [Gimesia alba]|uniref:Uncharacterized protein n=1 Tax=Gimesia alba TaxID=2527973 RepID=A0A517RFA3_9PLAN|nr:hypothetical protein Pan241w_26410 [Gimesia alba]
MRILWDNFFATVLFVFGLGVLLVMFEEIFFALSCIAHIGPGHPPGVQWTGLIALGFVCLTVAGIARFLILKSNTTERRDERRNYYE